VGGSLRTWDNNLDSKYLQGLLENSKDIEVLHLCGGEPLIIKSYTHLVKKLRDEGEHISLMYNTNLTVLRDEMFDIWKDFKQVKLLVSIDGIEDIYESIRVPTKWKTIKKNLEKLESKALKNMVIPIITTVNIENVYHLPDLLQWLIDQKFKKVMTVPFFNILYSPSHLSLINLTESDTQKIIEKYTKFLEDHQTVEYRNLILPFIKFMKNKDNFKVSTKKIKRRSKLLCQL